MLKTHGNISALDLVPFFDKEQAVTYDPMHMLCMGVIKSFFKHIMFDGDKYPRVARPPLASLSSVHSETCDAADDGVIEDVSSDEELLVNYTPTGMSSLRSAESGPTSATQQPATTSLAAARSSRPPSKRNSTTRVLLPKILRTRGSLLDAVQKRKYHELMDEVGGSRVRVTSEALASLILLPFQVILPPDVEKIAAPMFFESSSGVTTAAQWRTYARHFAPLVNIEMWSKNEARRIAAPGSYNHAMTESELQQLLRVSQIAETALRPVISSIHLEILRVYIKSLQDVAYRERPSIVACSNLHWLSHMPDDIMRYGPVYSWWLFVYERTNKMLKSANSNGHPQDTAVIAFNKFLKLGSLGINRQPSNVPEDPASKYLATKSAAAVEKAVKSANIIAEEKIAQRFQDEWKATAHVPHRLAKTTLSLETGVDCALTAEEMREIRDVWNADPASTTKVRDRDDRDEGELVLERTATFYNRFNIGRHRFHTPNPRDRAETPNEELKPQDFKSYCGCFFEERTEKAVLNALNERTAVGFFRAVFEVAAAGTSSEKTVKRFVRLSMLQPYTQPDPYRFQERMSVS